MGERNSNSASINELKFFKEFYSTKSNSKTSDTEETLKVPIFNKFLCKILKVNHIIFSKRLQN